MRRRPTTLALAVTLLAAACASGGGGGGSAGTGNVITAEQAAAVGSARNAYDVVMRLHPEFLRGRGTTSPRSAGEGRPTNAAGQPEMGVVVYVDGTHMGGIASLRDITVERIDTIRYLGASDATTKYGTGHTDGVIEVTTH